MSEQPTLEASAAAAITSPELKRKADPLVHELAQDAGHGGGGGAERGRGSSSKRGRGGRRGSGGGRQGADSAAVSDAAAGSSVGVAVPPVALTPMQQQFSVFARALDQRNDRRERVYQSSRDLTRASKKLITQLQRCTHASSPAERDAMLASARRKELAELHRLLAMCVAAFGEEGSGSIRPADYFRFSSALSPGVQEFIEAASFLHYLEHPGEMVTLQRINDDIAHTLASDQAAKDKAAAAAAAEGDAAVIESSITEGGAGASPSLRVSVPLSDYVLGLTDLGGELMRYASNSMTLGAVEGRRVVQQVGSFLRSGYAAFQLLAASLPPGGGGGGQWRDLPKKLEVWLQSLQKIELLAYKLHIRAAEFPHEADTRAMANALFARDTGGYSGGGGGGGGGGGDDEREGHGED